MEIRDIAYRVVSDQPLLGRLYRPAGAAAEAMVIEVHGGAWQMNDRLTNAVIHRHLAENGVSVFALDFRLAPQHAYPAAVNDVNYAIRWVKANFNPGHIGVLGSSSGAHQAVLAALRPDDPRYFTRDAALGDHDASVDFVVACWPILDPLARYRMARAKGMQNLVDAHHGFFPDENAMLEGNPHLVVERGEATSLPPMLVLQGTADENVEHERADAFAERYRRAGGEIELKKYPGQPHTFIIKDPGSPASQDALATISNYLRRRIV